MKRMLLAALALAVIAGAAEPWAQQGRQGGPGGRGQALPTTGGEGSWTPARINKIIELWEMGEPVYYTQINGGGYEEGLRLAQTPADYVTFNMEHSYVNVQELREFMRGLVDGGPTRSGHRTPAVVAVLPAWGWDEVGMRANAWLVGQIVNAGVHGLLLPHAVSPEAVRLMVEAVRFPFAPVAPGIGQGRQGSGSEGFAANIWGISAAEWRRRADPWPLNPDGELVLGLKIENIHAVERVEQLVTIPGIAFAEWGPGDQSMWMGARLGLGQPAPQNAPEMQAARARVFQAVKKAGGYFLNTCGNNDVTEMIDEGVMICTGGWQVGRPYTNRRMPW